MKSQRVPLPGSQRKAGADDHWLSTDVCADDVTVSVMLRRHTDAAADLLSGKYSAQSREEAERALAARPEDLAAVRVFAEQYGLAIVEENALARRVRLTGTVEQMGQAFGVTLGLAADAEGHRFLTYRGTISLPESLAGAVTAVLGLDQRPVARHGAPGAQ